MFLTKILVIICFSLKGKTRFYILKKKPFFENGFEVATYFIFLRENKIRKKPLNVTHNRKNKSVKIESRSES